MSAAHATTVAPAPPAASTAVVSSDCPVLVDGHWLAKHLDHVVVVDTRRTDLHDTARVPGSTSFPLGALLVEDTSGDALLRLGVVARQVLASRGVSADDHVVLVDDGDGTACLGMFICELAGVRAASVLRGGMVAAAGAGIELVHGPGELLPACAPWDAPDLPMTGNLATFESLADACLDAGARLLDARSQLEHEGMVGAPCCPQRGHVPGSMHLEWSCMLGPEGELATAERVRRTASDVGLAPTDEVIVYCHSGHRAAVAAVALRSAGYDRVRLSLGSWHEWSGRCMPVAPAPDPSPAAVLDPAPVSVVTTG